jgi:zinc transport system permease protein
MLDVLHLPFMQNAIWAGILTSIACGIIGSLVVVNRLVFLAGGVAHSAYGGVGLAFFLGLPVLPCTLGFTLFTSGLLGAITINRNERTDTIVGLIWAAGMASGIILIDFTPGYNVDLMSYLFGSILTVPDSDLWLMLVMDLIIIGLVGIFYRGFLVMSFDREYARTLGLPVTFFYFLLLSLVAVSVVMVIQVVGLILVIALLTIPAYLAERKSLSLAGMMWRSILWSVVFCLLGLCVSLWLNITSGAAIIAVATITFFVFLCLDFCRKRWLRRFACKK